ncbi:Homocysteine S-methyltransferase 2 [Zea mays]|uniref:Homocysteine S-methyltransferase 2 n=1 Tax=Zea mays TaxID=4577 RepID=A0A1D6KFY0_MAIZE|nr:Homocysteine S-methyltransferase 2 [Zea mays]
MDYLEAGANIIITASYQATIQGFESKGFSKEQSENLLTKSVEIALEAREMFLKEHLEKSTPIQHPVLVAASLGSYGAYLADGSEYSGDYGEAGTKEFLKDFHRRRLQVLAEAGPDLIAFETIPNKLEAEAYVELLEECNINIPAWFSFNSKDGVHIVSGDSLIECTTIADKCAKVGAVGINCTPPRFIHGLILSIRKVSLVSTTLCTVFTACLAPPSVMDDCSTYPCGVHIPWSPFLVYLGTNHCVGDGEGCCYVFTWITFVALPQVTDKPILIYPNSGERYDGEKKEWVESTGVSDGDFVSYVNEWCKDGAVLIGGCCRTTPNTIRAIHRTLNKSPNKQQLPAVE